MKFAEKYGGSTEPSGSICGAGKKPPPPEELNRFFELFRKSRGDKASFMDVSMESYFSLPIKKIGESGILKFYTLEFNSAVAAMSLTL